MSDHTQPCEETVAYVRDVFVCGYETACADMAAAMKRQPAAITVEQSHQIRTGIADLGNRAADRYMQMFPTPARTDAASEQDARGGQSPS